MIECFQLTLTILLVLGATGTGSHTMCSQFKHHNQSHMIATNNEDSSKKIMDYFDTNTCPMTTNSKKVESLKPQLDLQGRVLKACVINSPPFLIVKERFDGKLVASGPQYNVLHSLEVAFNFTTEFMWSPDGKFGAKEKDGSFNGIIGVLQRGEADIAINAVSLTSDRAKAADASLPLGNYDIGIYYKTLGDNDIDWSKYVLPFNKYTWLYVLAMVAIICLIYNSAALMDMDNLDVLPIMHAQFCQGFPNEPSSVSRRIMFLCAYVFGYLIWNYYASALTAILAISKTSVPFTNLHTLLHESNHIVLTRDGASYATTLKEGGPTEREIYNTRTLLFPSWGPVFEKMESISNGAALGPIVSMRKYTTDISCQYKMIPKWSIKQMYSFYFRKNFRYKKHFDHHLQKMKESGFLHKSKTAWMKDWNVSNCKSNEVKPLSLENVIFPFILLAGFYLTVNVIVYLEYLKKRIFKKLVN